MNAEAIDYSKFILMAADDYKACGMYNRYGILKDAAASLKTLQKRLDYIKANQTDGVAVRFALIASDEEITAKELDGDE